MARLPTGTVTLVFTDIEGSTRLLHHLGDAYEGVLATHRRLLREALSSPGGVEVDTQGDALFYAFARARDAVEAAAAAQQALSDHDWPEQAQVRVRIGIHSGEPTVTAEGYVGADVHFAARICAAGHGGQVLVSDATAHLLPRLEGFTLRSLGEHSLKDIEGPVVLHQGVAEGMAQDFPPLRSRSSSHPTNLPARLEPLIGRDDDVDALVELLRSDDVSVVTVVGPGGTGKTRVALALGAQLVPLLADGVFFVDLSALTDNSLVVPAIAQALSLRETPGRSLAESLAEHLSSRQMLVILDNFEQVIEAASEVSSLVIGAPGLKVVVTSREALRIAGERVVSLSPLAVPFEEQADLEEVARSPAVALFVARARAVTAGFALTPDNAADVAGICRRLDGLPLALELAAARVNVLSPSALLSRLDAGLKVLTSGRRDAAARQRTLRGAIAWSYDLLSPDEQTLFRRLGVFAGGWSLQAAERVCDRGDLDLDVLDCLGSLVDKSLVRTAKAQDERFSMLETIREFASERLEESGEAEGIRRGHAEFFRGLTEEAEPHLVGTDQKLWLDRFEKEHDNIRAMLQWALSRSQRLAVEAVADLSRFWYMRGYLSEGRGWLERALEVDALHTTTPRLRIMARLSGIAYAQGDLAVAAASAQRGLALAHELGDERGVMHCTESLALCAMERGDYVEARGYFDDNLRRSRALGDDRAAAVTTTNIALLAMLRGDHRDAASLSNESFKIYSELGDKEGMAGSLIALGFNELLNENALQAEDYLRQGLHLAADIGQRELIGSALEGLASVAAKTGDPRAGAIRFGAAEQARRDTSAALDAIELRIRDDATEEILRSLTTEEFEKLVANGASMSLDEVKNDITRR